MKFPTGYHNILQSFAYRAVAYAKEEYRQLARAGISIIGVVFARGEHFVMRKQKGETHLIRIRNSKLQEEGQKRLDSMSVGDA